MSGMVVITVEYADGRPSRTTLPMDVEDAIGGMRDIAFRVALGEFSAAYLTNAKPLSTTVRTLKTETT